MSEARSVSEGETRPSLPSAPISFPFAPCLWQAPILPDSQPSACHKFTRLLEHLLPALEEGSHVLARELGREVDHALSVGGDGAKPGAGCCGASDGTKGDELHCQRFTLLQAAAGKRPTIANAGTVLLIMKKIFCLFVRFVSCHTYVS